MYHSSWYAANRHDVVMTDVRTAMHQGVSLVHGSAVVPTPYRAVTSPRDRRTPGLVATLVK
jgi:hypothetical protein